MPVIIAERRRQSKSAGVIYDRFHAKDYCMRDSNEQNVTC